MKSFRMMRGASRHELRELAHSAVLLTGLLSLGAGAILPLYAQAPAAAAAPASSASATGQGAAQQANSNNNVDGKNPNRTNGQRNGREGDPTDVHNEVPAGSQTA